MAKTEKQGGKSPQTRSSVRDPVLGPSGSGSGSGFEAGPSSARRAPERDEAPEVIDVEDERAMRALIRGKGPMDPKGRKRVAAEELKPAGSALHPLDPDLVSWKLIYGNREIGDDYVVPVDVAYIVILHCS